MAKKRKPGPVQGRVGDVIADRMRQAAARGREKQRGDAFKNCWRCKNARTVVIGEKTYPCPECRPDDFMKS